MGQTNTTLLAFSNLFDLGGSAVLLIAGWMLYKNAPIHFSVDAVATRRNRRFKTGLLLLGIGFLIIVISRILSNIFFPVLL